MERIEVSVGSRVLLLWGANNTPESIKDAVNVLTQKVGQEGKVQVENMERLHLCEFLRSTTLPRTHE